MRQKILNVISEVRNDDQMTQWLQMTDMRDNERQMREAIVARKVEANFHN